MDCICRPSRIMAVRINLLDETEFIHEIKDDLPGQALLDVVFARLNLIETSYFGIRYIDEENQTHWLDPASRISRQLKPKTDPFDLYFGVKFYTADPCKLLEEITRYQLFLQVKQDVLQGRLPVSFELAAELGAFVVQSELGDYDSRRHSKGYVSEFRLLPNQSSELETRVAELHQQLKGMLPASAELNYLDKVKWHDMYGVDLHPVLGEDSVEYFLGLTPSGIVVLRNKTTVAHYYWPRIAKVYYKGRYFMLRISDKNNDLSTYGFETPRKSACKHLWRCCVEHHAFFRLVRVAPLPSSQSTTSDLFQLGSRLRYSGRTEKQAAKDALSIGRTPPAFTRVPSKRQPRRVIDDFLSGSKNVEGYNGGAAVNAAVMLGKGTASLQPTTPTSSLPINYDSPYLSTYSIPTTLGIRPYHQQQPHNSNNGYHNTGNSNNNAGSGGSNLQTPDSPRSTRSAPWPRSQQRSLFGNNPSSPRSVRSASTTGAATHQHHHQHQQHRQHQQQQQSRHQSGGGGDGASTTNQQRYRSSSVESHSSNDSRSTRRNKHRHRRTSDNESELSRGSGRSGRSHHRKHRRSRHRRDSAGSDHESSRGRSYSGHRVSSGRSGSAELIDSTSQWREVQRRQAEASLGQSSVQQASVSKSNLVARSLHSNDSHSDTHSHHKSRRHRKNKSPSDRNRIWSSELAKHLQFGLVDTAGMSEDQLREIPYTVVETNSKRSNSNLKIHKSSSKSSVGGKSNGSGNTLTNGSGGAHSATSGGQGKNRVDRIRGSNPNDSNGTKNGSIRSASTISSRECERNSGLVRMMSSMSMGDFISPTGSNLSPLENSALRVSHEHTDSGLGADQDYAYSSERSSDSTRYGTNKSSGASSGSHRKSACGSNNGGAAYNNMMQHQTVSSQQQQKRQNSLYAQRQHQQPTPHSSVASSSSVIHHHASSFKYPTNHTQSSLAPIHNHNTSPHASNHNSNEYPHPSSSSHSNSATGSLKANNNPLRNYTTFENNQYKFSLNNVYGGKNTPSGGGGYTNLNMDSFLEMPHSAAAPYYYNGPPTTSVHVKKRDAKSDIGVPTRRASGVKAITKTQLLTGQPASSAAYYPLQSSPSYAGGSGGLAARLHPAKSDLFLSYLHSTAGVEYERPHIYNYKMPQMPEFMRHPSTQQQKNSAAYHISGAQTADLPPLYKPATASGNVAGGNMYAGAAPASDVVYYQFDNSQHAAAAPIVQQPKSANAKGPLVFLQHAQQQHATSAVGSQQLQQTCSKNSTNTNNRQHQHLATHSNTNSPCSDDDDDDGDENLENGNDDDDDAVDGDEFDTENNKHDKHAVNKQIDIIAEHNLDDDDDDNADDDVTHLDACNMKSSSAVRLSHTRHYGSSKSIKSTTTATAPHSCAIKTNLCTSASVGTHKTVVSSDGKNTINNNNIDNCHENVNATQSTNTTITTITTNSNTNSGTLNANPTSRSQNPNRNRSSAQTHNQFSNSNTIQNQNSNISSSLEIILSPIIQSSRRAQ